MRLTKGMKDLIIEMENYIIHDKLFLTTSNTITILYPENVFHNIHYYFSEKRINQENNVKYFKRCIKYGIFNDFILSESMVDVDLLDISIIKNGGRRQLYEDIVLVDDSDSDSDSEFISISSEIKSSFDDYDSSSDEECYSSNKEKLTGPYIKIYISFKGIIGTYTLNIYKKPPTMVKSARK